MVTEPRIASLQDSFLFLFFRLFYSVSKDSHCYIGGSDVVKLMLS